jgi:hypothetical protein
MKKKVYEEELSEALDEELDELEEDEISEDKDMPCIEEDEE